MGGGISFRTALRERLNIINVTEHKVCRIMIVHLVSSLFFVSSYQKIELWPFYTVKSHSLKYSDCTSKSTAQHSCA